MVKDTRLMCCIVVATNAVRLIVTTCEHICDSTTLRSEGVNKMPSLEELQMKLDALEQTIQEARSIMNGTMQHDEPYDEPCSFNPKFPCKKGCGRTITMAYTAKNNKSIVLSQVEDEDAGEYIMLPNGKAQWVGGYGTHTFHFRKDGTCKSPAEIEE
jgi:hypothetical protein